MATLDMDLFAIQQQLRASGQIPQELVEVFREEAEEHMRAIYDGLDRLCVQLNDFDALADVRRTSHTLKGAAGAVGYVAISRLSHRMEDLLDFLSENKQPLTMVQLELLLVTADQLQELSSVDFDFDETAKSLLDVYQRFEQQFTASQPADTSSPTPCESASEDHADEHTTQEYTDEDVIDESLIEAFLADESLDDEGLTDDEYAIACAAMLGGELPTDLQTLDNIEPTESTFADLFQNASEEENARVATADEADANADLARASIANSEPAREPIDPAYLELAFEQLNACVDVSPEIQAIFSEEAQDLLRAIYRGLDHLKQNLSDHSALSDVRRSAHTLKGAAGAVGMEGITRLAHRMEDLLDALSDKNHPMTSSQLEVMLVTADRIQDLTSGPLEIVEVAEAMAGLYARYDREMLAYQGQSNTEVTHHACESANKPAVATQAGESSPLPNVRPTIAHAASREAQEVDSSPITFQSNVAATKPVDSQPSNSGQYLRVPLERIDSLVALIGEMVVNRSAMNQRLADFTSRIQDMQLAVNRFRTIAQDMEKSFGFAAMHSRSRELRTAAGHRAKGKDGKSTVNRIASFNRPEIHGLLHSPA
ncbi:MAG: Hpt domain-containing protein, partial [Pirellulaceae bacterium]|nr:Hpt domain-containing protein [Pirellulaceae bacterium]